MFCWRCGKKLKRNGMQMLVLPEGIEVPVCADDRTCPPTVNGSKRKLRKLKGRR